MKHSFRFRQNWGLGGLLFLLFCVPAHARGHKSPSPPTPSALRTQAFALGYALRVSEGQALRFTQAVKTLKDVDDDKAAGAEIARLAEQAGHLRKTEAECYAKIAGLPELSLNLRQWASDTAAGFRAPLVLLEEEKTLAKTEPLTATVMAELDELRAANADVAAHQPGLTAGLKLSGGKESLWAADLGSLTADLNLSGQGDTGSPVAVITLRRLLSAAPPGTPSAVLESLANLIPRGGNLQFLAPVTAVKVPPQERDRALKTFVNAYDARKLAEALDKER